MKKVQNGKHFLLGKRGGTWYYLEQGSFDCGWYWGCGYVHGFSQNNLHRSCQSHSHFDSMFLNDKHNGFDAFRGRFEETTLNNDEVWKLVELMRSFYTARSYADFLHIGGSHYTTNPAKSAIQNDAEYKRINETVIPAIMREVYTLLSPYGEYYEEESNS